jgi:hypothetical protein
MKKVIIALALSSILSVTASGDMSDMTPEAYLKLQAENGKESSKYLSNLFFTAGGASLASALIVESTDNKNTNAYIGAAATAIGFGFKYLPNEVVKQYNKTQDNPGYSASEAIKAVQAYQKRTRYMAAAFFLVPMLIDFAGEETSNNKNPDDANTTVKIISGAMAINMLFCKTPFEKTSAEVLKNPPSSLIIQLQPSLEDIKLSATYKF